MMRMVFVLTHLTMVVTTFLVFLNALGFEPEASENDDADPNSLAANFFNKCRALGCNTKSGVALVSGQLGRLMVFIRSSGRIE